MASGLQLWSRKLEIDGTTKNCLSVTWLFWLLGWSLSSFSKRNCRGYRYAISTPLSIKGTWEPCMRSPMVIRALPQWLVHQRSRCWLYDLCSLVCKENNLSWRECSRQKQFLIFFLNLSVGEIPCRNMEEIQIKYWPKYQFSQQPQKRWEIPINWYLESVISIKYACSDLQQQFLDLSLCLSFLQWLLFVTAVVVVVSFYNIYLVGIAPKLPLKDSIP